jgi:predicted  nucleic acid-binding Zn-ribbon protein
MASVVDLYALHRFHLALKSVQDELARGPRLVRARDNQLAQLDVEKKTKEEELKQTRAATDRKNLDLKSSEAKLKDLDRKLNEAASNREFDILKGQIAADQASNAVLQDEILESLEKVDRIQAEIAAIAERRAKLEAERNAFAKQIEAQAVGLRQQEAELKGQVQVSEKMIPESIKAHYRRLVDAYGADGMSPIDNGMCLHCYVSLTPQIAVVIDTGTPTFCPSCDRLLYSAKSQGSLS